MDRREFVAILMAAGVVSVGINVGCGRHEPAREEPAAKTTPDANSAATPKEANGPNVNANVNAAADNSATAKLGDDAPDGSPKGKGRKPRHKARSDDPAGEYDTYCENSKGRLVPCCNFANGDYGPCNKKDR
jgi:hypothetical protein